MKHVIGDTIRLKIIVKNLAGIEEAPGTISVKVYTLDGVKLYEDAAPTLVLTAKYHSDWEISGVTSAAQLIALWEWSGPHKKKILFNVVPIM